MNEGWKNRWRVDLEKHTATHEDGWIFVFREVEKGVWDGRAISYPNNISVEDLNIVASIAKQAGEVWNDERKNLRKM